MTPPPRTVTCCDLVLVVRSDRSTVLCHSCGTRHGAPGQQRPSDPFAGRRLSAAARRATDTLLLLGGSATPQAVASAARMTTREAARLLRNAGCTRITEKGPRGVELTRYELPPMPAPRAGSVVQ